MRPLSPFFAASSSLSVLFSVFFQILNYFFLDFFLIASTFAYAASFSSMYPDVIHHLYQSRPLTSFLKFFFCHVFILSLSIPFYCKYCAITGHTDARSNPSFHSATWRAGFPESASFFSPMDCSSSTQIV